MKRILLILVMTTWFLGECPGQEGCIVRLEVLKGTYIGKCKRGYAHGKGKAIGTETYEGKFRNGLPHGKGTWYYRDSSVYTGRFQEGEKHGRGELTIPQPDNDSLISGYWEEDEYVGKEKPKDYDITKSYSIDRYSVYRVGEQKSIIRIKFLQNGAANSNISDLRLWGSSGFQMSGLNRFGYESVEFPFTGKIEYKTRNKMGTTRLDCRFEFVINKPGQWEVVLHN